VVAKVKGVETQPDAGDSDAEALPVVERKTTVQETVRVPGDNPLQPKPKTRR
jgi:hypothetical protein